MRKSKGFVDNARECFRQAAAAPNIVNMRLLIELGLEYLRMADGDAQIRPGPDADVPIRIH